MIVVDSSVWISLLRRQASRAVSRLQALVEDDDDQILVGDLILLEVLQGARDARIEHDLRRYPIVSMLDESIAVRSARNYRLLRAGGITVCKTVDMIIGTLCLTGGHALLHDDRDFDPLAKHLGLRVASA